MNKKISEAFQKIENQLLTINSQNVSLRWIGMKQGPTEADLFEHNKILGFIIAELRELRETGDLDAFS